MKQDHGLQVLPYYPRLVPGIDQVVLVLFSPYTDGIQGFILRNDEGEYVNTKLTIKSGAAFFTDLVRNPASFTWFARNQLPFEIKDHAKVQLTIFNELNNSILLLNYPIQEQQHDFHFIYFNENLSNFLLDKVSEPFSAQHKSMVGHLLFHSVSALYHAIADKVRVTTTLNDQIQTIVTERNNLQDSLQKSQTKSRTDVLKLVDFYLTQFGKERKVQILLTDAAKVKLRDYTGDITRIGEMLTNAVELASIFYEGSVHSSILIADYHIRFPVQEEPRLPSEIAEHLPQRLIKTHLLLDRLELAAVGLKERRTPLTSANVGKEFPSPISAPAISDALRKHKVRILDLFRQYPDKWEVIRHEFRPIQNLLDGHYNQDSIPA